MTARPATDPDLWWHLRTGQWIVDTGHIPHADPFSFTRAGQPWVAHEWLTEIAFYQLWKHAGPAALIVFSAIVTTAGFMLLYLRCYATRHWAAAATAIGALASAPSWGSRPQMFTFTLTSLFLWLIENAEDRPKLLFWIPPLFLLWLNLHAGFALGLALVFAYGVGLLMETAFGDTPWQQARPILLRIALALAVCLALVPLNPAGTLLYRYPFDTLRSPGMRSFIGEWFSPDFHQWLYRPFLLVWLLLLAALATSRYRPRGRAIVPLLLTSIAALDAVRHIPIFILVAVPVIAAALPISFTPPANSQPRSGVHRFRLLFNGAVIVLIAVLALIKWVDVARHQQAREAEHFPQAAVTLLRAHNYPRNLFVYYDWGGYAIWKLYPEYHVFVDGRADLYGDDILNQFRTATQLHTGWHDVLDHWNVQAVLIPPSTALAQALFLDPSWRTAYSDANVVILTRAYNPVENTAFLQPLFTGAAPE